jgi:hypothetical protein
MFSPKHQIWPPEWLSSKWTSNLPGFEGTANDEGVQLPSAVGKFCAGTPDSGLEPFPILVETYYLQAERKAWKIRSHLLGRLFIRGTQGFQDPKGTHQWSTSKLQGEETRRDLIPYLIHTPYAFLYLLVTYNFWSPSCTNTMLLIAQSLNRNTAGSITIASHLLLSTTNRTPLSMATTIRIYPSLPSTFSAWFLFSCSPTGFAALTNGYLSRWPASWRFTRRAVGHYDRMACLVK